MRIVRRCKHRCERAAVGDVEFAVSVGLALEANIGRNLMLYGGLDAGWRKHQDMQSIQAGLKYVW